MPEAAAHVGSGKVRELYALDDERLLLVATDRISTFDVVLPTEIPDKGRVLTGLVGVLVRPHAGHRARTTCSRSRDDGRSPECRRLEMLPIECVVRGYLSGSGWKDYRGDGRDVCGHALPAGLRESDRLPEPIFTPATKAQAGHDENIDARAARPSSSARSASREVERIALALYAFAAEYARERGIIIADTKFEFGLDAEGRLVLGDEALTPDSSRFWPADEYAPGRRAAVVRQAVRPRLLRDARLGQDRPGPGAARRRRRGHARALRRGVRARDRDRVRRVPRGPGGGAPVKATVLVRPKEGILDPQGQAVEGSLRQLGLRRRRGAGRPGRRSRARGDGRRRRRAPRSSACASSCSRTR